MKLIIILFSIVLASMVTMEVQAQNDNQTDCILTCETENETAAEEPSGSISSFNSGVIIVK